MTGKTPVQLIRDLAIRRRALLNYAQMHESLSELEQMYIGVGRAYEAEGAAAWARVALRAYQAEINDPEPPADHDDDVREGRW